MSTSLTSGCDIRKRLWPVGQSATIITFIYIITPLLTSTHKPMLARAPSSTNNYCSQLGSAHSTVSKEISLMALHFWLDNSKPKSGLVACIMRSTRYEYHSQVKWVKQNIRYMQSQKMSTSMVMGNTSDHSNWSK